MTLLRQIESITDRYSPAHRVAVSGFLGYYPAPEAFELFDSNPGIGLLLAYCGTFRRSLTEPWSEARQRIKDPRRSILGWLGFPASKSAVRIVAKIDVERMSVEHCLTLRDLLFNESTACTLRHLPVLCDGVVDVLAEQRFRCLVPHAVLEELCHRKDDDIITGLIGEVLQLAAYHDFRLRPFFCCDSVIVTVEHLRSLEGALKPEWHRHYEDIIFPDPPITVPLYSQPPGILIEPIRSPRELFDEAMTQHNCVFDRLEWVESGDAAIYRVLQPERATVLLRRSGDGIWVISEFRAARNRPVRRETLWAIGAYLSRRQETTYKEGEDEQHIIGREKIDAGASAHPDFSFAQTDYE